MSGHGVGQPGEGPRVTPEQVAAFERDGVVVVRGVLRGEQLAAAQRAVDDVVAHPGPLAIVASRPDDPGRFVEDFCRWQDVGDLEQVVRRSPAADVAAALLGASTVRFFHDHVLVKEAGTRQRTPWHQDQPYYNVDGRSGVSLWIPLDPVPRDACLEVVTGTHTGPWLLPRSFLDDEAKWFPEGSLEELPDIDADLEAEPGSWRVVTDDLEPGDAVCFHFLAVHGAPGSTGRRRVLSLRFLGDDMVHAPRPWRTSPPFPGLDASLPAGAPLDHPLFPVVWPR